MRQSIQKLSICLALAPVMALAQTKPTFDVATIKPAAPLDPARIAAAMQGGGKLPIGANIDGLRAEYNYLDLKSLLTYAYGVKPYQISGPDWMSTTRFDIVGKMPEGSKKEDAPKMLQSLLEERFKLAVHKTSAEHPVLALVAGKGGPKLKPSTDTPVAIDETAPLKQGEMKVDGADGPVRMRIDPQLGSVVIDMGLKGKMAYKPVPATQSMHIEFSMTTMDGFADMMTQLFSQLGGATGGRQVVNMTGIQGNYDASVDISIAEILAMARAAGADIPQIPARGPGGQGNGVISASDPSGGSSLNEAVASLGLKLENRKATVDQLVVDHIEKTPTEN
jgi:uncharacterized protein (TIGR03435 family)